MGGNKKHKSKKHKTHYHSDEKDIMKVVLRVPPSEQDSFLVRYPLEAIARARIEGVVGHTHKTHWSSNSKKPKKRRHSNHSHLSSALIAAGLEDISEDSDDLEGGDFVVSEPRLGGTDHTQERAEMSLRVAIDLEKLSLEKQKNQRRRSSWVDTPNDTFATPATNVADSTPPNSSQHKKKKKKKKHKHQQKKEIEIETDFQTNMLPEVTTPPHVEEMEWEEPVSPASMDQAPSSHEVVTAGIDNEESYLWKEEYNKLDTEIISTTEESIRSTISPSSTASSQRQRGVPRTALKYFLRHLHTQVCRNDPEGVFSEPVTDEIAPGYFSIIKNPMDCQTMGIKIENNEYTSVKEFKDDFILMCNNAMTYNAPETLYYQVAKKLLSMGLKMIQKEVSVRPDIIHGLVPTYQPLPPPSLYQLDYSSPFLCRINLSMLQQPSLEDTPLIDVGGEPIEPILDQSHLTQLQIGFTDTTEQTNDLPLLVPEHDTLASPDVTNNHTTDSEEDILQHVDNATKLLNEANSDKIPAELSALSKDENGVTLLHILNPHSVSPLSVNLNSLNEKIKAGQSASTVLNSELPVFKATPVSYLMYGPFGSFAPTYDTAFATLTKNDSSLLLTTYGSELGISYANSLQQFVKGCGSFASEMGNAILNSLTNGRHTKFLETILQKGIEDKSVKEQATKAPANVESKELEEDSPPTDVELSKESSEILTARETNSTPNQVEKSPGIVDVQREDQNVQALSHTSQLILSLEEQQRERLSEPPLVTHTGQLALAPPNKQEVETASKITSQLGSLSSQVEPAELVSTETLRKAMGVDLSTTVETSIMNDTDTTVTPIVTTTA